MQKSDHQTLNLIMLVRWICNVNRAMPDIFIESEADHISLYVVETVRYC